jgi:hypothetical protein
LSAPIAYSGAHLAGVRTQEYAKAWRLAPDLVAEAVSPHQYRPEMTAKPPCYLAVGARLVWLMWPTHQQVEVRRIGPDAAVTLGSADALDGQDVVLGFAYPIARLSV